jgi:hypothetical protein
VSDSPKFQQHAFDKKLRGRHAIGVEVKQKYDPEITLLKEAFGFGGYQVHRVPQRHEEKEVPAWAIKDESLRAILLAAFPKLNTNTSQRKAAARWAQAIQLYYRQGCTRTEVAEEMMETENAIMCLVHRIKKLAEKVSQ